MVELIYGLTLNSITITKLVLSLIINIKQSTLVKSEHYLNKIFFLDFMNSKRCFI